MLIIIRLRVFKSYPKYNLVVNFDLKQIILSSLYNTSGYPPRTSCLH